MKKTSLLISFFTLLLSLNAQDDPATAYLQTNNIQAFFSTDGRQFWDGQQGQFLVGDQANISPIRNAGLWLGGRDEDGNLKGAIQLYNEDNRRDFQPYDWNSGTDTFDKIFRVKGADIEAHLIDFADNDNIDNPIDAIYQWPGRGNPHFADYFGFDLPETFGPLAPFWDNNGNGIYNPDEGDFPIVDIRGCEIPIYADEMMYLIYNDERPHTQSMMAVMNMEVHTLAYAFSCSENQLLNNTIFVQHKLINRGMETLEDTHFGLYLDFALGCSQNDYIATNRDFGSLFAYNKTETDPDCGDEEGYQSQPPVASVTLLRGPLDQTANELNIEKTMPLFRDDNDLPAAMQFPQTAAEYYNYLTGKWRDGSPLTYGGDGYQTGAATDYVFPDNPTDSEGWSEYALDRPGGPRSMLMSSGPFNLFPGAVNELLLAYSFHQNPGANNLENVEAMYDSIVQLRALFDNCFEIGSATLACTSPVTSVNAPNSLNHLLKCYPNPANKNLTIDISGIQPDQIRLVNAQGQTVYQKRQPESIHTIDVQHLPSGLYLVEVTSKGRSGVKKILVE